MRLLVAPQEFKGTLTARDAAQAICDGVLRARPAWTCELAPLADGGPGTLEALLTARKGRRLELEVEDPIGRPVRAGFALLEDGTAVVEMAQASGLWRVAPAERDALRASTFGTGQLIAAALDEGARELVVGVGGSATSDAGAGALQSLGFRLLDTDGHELERGAEALLSLAQIDRSQAHPALGEAMLRVATDVQNPLLGPTGAARIYGPQKGASAQEVELLERAHAHFAEVVRTLIGQDLSMQPGAGAAGGLAFGLCALTGATLVSGFDEIASAMALDQRIGRSDRVLTGEGRLDAQTAFGKGPQRLAARAHAFGRRVICFAGTVTSDAAVSVFDDVIAVSPRPQSLTSNEARARLERAAFEWASRVSPE